MNTPAIPMDSHALARCAGVRDIPPAAVVAIASDKCSGVNLKTTDVAVLIFTFPAPKGDRYSATASNGENLWAIIRGGIILTVYYRRTSQPSDKTAFRVDRVIR